MLYVKIDFKKLKSKLYYTSLGGGINIEDVILSCFDKFSDRIALEDSLDEAITSVGDSK